MQRFFFQIITKGAIILLLALSLVCNYGFDHPVKVQAIPQKSYEKGYFQSPLNIPLYLSGTFGELRSNHFHSGLDIKTNAQEGLPVLAAASGYVSRIRVQAAGFGKSIYITHPNGFVTVYAHLKSYNPAIGALVKSIQYRSESFEIDSLLPPGFIEVKKGEVIAHSGNTGGSAGPHLHFEIRDAQTEEPVNPLLFGFAIKDDVLPIIRGVYVYRLSENRLEKSPASKQKVPAQGALVDASGETGIGIDTYDRLTGSANPCGVYSIELKSDGKRIYYSKMERFFFEQTRYINSHCDYREKEKTGKWIQKSFIEPGNKLGIYKDLVNRGRIFIKPGDLMKMEYIVKDMAGNTTTYHFTLQGRNPHLVSGNAMPSKSKETYFPHDRENLFVFPDIRLKFPPHTFYDTIGFEYSNAETPDNGYSLLHRVKNTLTPVHDTFEIAIRPVSLPERLQSKALIFHVGKGSAGGNWNKGFVKTNAKYLGNFFVRVDTVPPHIKPLSLPGGKGNASSSLSFKIGDNLAGIKSYRATLNGKWLLMEFDAKSGRLSAVFDEGSGKGKQDFRLVVTDRKNNINTYRTIFTR